MTQPSAKATKGTPALAAQLFGLAVGPAAWIGQLVIGYGLSSYSCFPGDAPRSAPPPVAEHGLLLAVNLACVALALSGLLVSLAGLRRHRGDKTQDRATTNAAATPWGRSRFLAMCGVLSASAFAIAILFDTPSTLALRLCWRFTA